MSEWNRKSTLHGNSNTLAPTCGVPVPDRSNFIKQISRFSNLDHFSPWICLFLLIHKTRNACIIILSRCRQRAVLKNFHFVLTFELWRPWYCYKYNKYLKSELKFFSFISLQKNVSLTVWWRKRAKILKNLKIAL